MNEVIYWRKNNVSFSRYLNFRVCVESTNFIICDVIVEIASHLDYTYDCLFKSLDSIKMKFGQTVLILTNIANLFLALLYWFLLCFHKMDLYCNLLIFSRWCILFLIVLLHTFRRVKNHKVIFGVWLWQVSKWKRAWV